MYPPACAEDRFLICSGSQPYLIRVNARLQLIINQIHMFSGYFQLFPIIDIMLNRVFQKKALSIPFLLAFCISRSGLAIRQGLTTGLQWNTICPQSCIENKKPQRKLPVSTASPSRQLAAECP